jgi:hypothetical protein
METRDAVLPSHLYSENVPNPLIVCGSPVLSRAPCSLGSHSGTWGHFCAETVLAERGGASNLRDPAIPQGGQACAVSAAQLGNGEPTL